MYLKFVFTSVGFGSNSCKLLGCSLYFRILFCLYMEMFLFALGPVVHGLGLVKFLFVLITSIQHFITVTFKNRHSFVSHHYPRPDVKVHYCLAHRHYKYEHSGLRTVRHASTWSKNWPWATPATWRAGNMIEAVWLAKMLRAFIPTYCNLAISRSQRNTDVMSIYCR